MSSSCRPRKYHGAFDGFGVWLVLASSQQRGVDEHREDEREREARQRGDELGGEQVRPGVHLVDRCRLDLLDRAALDDGQQALGVPTGAGADGHLTGAGRGGHDGARTLGEGDGATRRRRLAAGGVVGALGLGLGGARALEEVGRDPRLGLRRGGGRLGGWRLGSRRGVGRAGIGRLLVARRLRPLQQVFGDLGHETPIRSAQRASHHSGPEMPPSLRTRQKWIAMKMTMMNGNSSTCSTYHRNSVSGPISAPPRSTKRT